MSAARRLPLLPLLLLLGPSLPGACAAGQDGRPVVAVSVPPHAWLVERLAGAWVDVVVMVPPGASPATHEPTLGQLRAVDRAALYVKVGHPHFPFEKAWLDRLVADREDLPTVSAAAPVETREHDPHVWLSPPRMEALVAPVAAALAEVVPEHADAVREAEAETRARIRELHETLRQIFADARGKTFMVFHPAWGYLAEEYGLVQLAIEREAKEPDARELGRLIERARGLGIDVIFVQPQFDPASARVIAEEIGAEVRTLDPLARDWDDNLRAVAREIAKAARG